MLVKTKEQKQVNNSYKTARQEVHAVMDKLSVGNIIWYLVLRKKVFFLGLALVSSNTLWIIQFSKNYF